MHEFLKRIRQMQKNGQLKTDDGKLYRVAVQHDDWCRLMHNKGECNCNPTIVQTEVKIERHLHN
jgi:hypothetical protein